MLHVFDAAHFAKKLKTKRIIELSINLRSAAKKIGISASTLSRLENNKMPEIDTFLKICNWLNELPREFIVTPHEAKYNKKSLTNLSKSIKK